MENMMEGQEGEAEEEENLLGQSTAPPLGAAAGFSPSRCLSG